MYGNHLLLITRSLNFQTLTNIIFGELILFLCQGYLRVAVKLFRAPNFLVMSNQIVIMLNSDLRLEIRMLPDLDVVSVVLVMQVLKEAQLSACTVFLGDLQAVLSRPVMHLTRFLLLTLDSAQIMLIG